MHSKPSAHGGCGALRGSLGKAFVKQHREKGPGWTGPIADCSAGEQALHPGQSPEGQGHVLQGHALGSPCFPLQVQPSLALASWQGIRESQFLIPRSATFF